MGFLVLASTVGMVAAPIVIGDVASPYASYLVIEADAFAPSPFVFEVRYSDLDRPTNSYELLSMVLLGNSMGMTADFINYGTVDDPNYFVDSITYNGVTIASETFPGPPATYLYWAQYISGGTTLPYGEVDYEPVPADVWQWGDGMNARGVIPGSWDGYIFGDGSAAPSVAPIPEPHAIYFLLIAGGILYGFRVWRVRHIA